MKIKYNSLILISLLSFSSCEDFLEPQPHDRLSEIVAWSSIENANLYVNGFYSYLTTYSIFGSSQFGGSGNPDGMTDMLKYGSSAPGAGNANLYAYEPTKISPDQNALGIWADAYGRIRRLNEFLGGIDTYAKFDESSKTVLKAQTRFFRAYIYYLLTMRHGSVILIKELTTEKNHPRSPESECWDFIAEDLDYAIANLPEEWDQANEGRLTKGAALALKSRAMLFAENWEAAKTAAEGVIELKNAGLYDLASQYKDAFKSRSMDNKESILEMRYARPAPVHSFDKTYCPAGDKPGPGAGAMACPTQEMVELYEDVNGNKVDWTPWHSSTISTPPYAQLEPRFQASVLYNGAIWKGRSIESFVGGSDGYMDYAYESYPAGKTTTGYFLKKYLDESNNDVVNQSSVQTLIVFRYAEVLLNYAEACYHLNRPDLANDAIRQIRSRVSLPYTDLTGNELLKKIQNERKIELAFEGFNYWDIRRWKLGETELNNRRLHALKITKSGNVSTYQYVECDNLDRKFLEKLYHFPIPSSEISNNTACEQIELW